MARAKKSAAPMIRRPVAALKRRKPTAAKPRMTNQKRIKVFVSTVTLYALLIVILYNSLCFFGQGVVRSLVFAATWEICFHFGKYSSLE